MVVQPEKHMPAKKGPQEAHAHNHGAPPHKMALEVSRQLVGTHAHNGPHDHGAPPHKMELEVSRQLVSNP
jgi:hypothetical protein